MQEWTAVAGGADATIAIRRYKNITVPASVTVSVSGGTATLNTDYTVSPAMPRMVSFGAGEVEKTFTIHANPGSAGKTIVLQLAGYTNATSDYASTSTVRIERLFSEMIQQVGFPAQTLTPGVNKTGSINGRVTTFNTNIGLANADVFLLNPYNSSQYYWHGHTNSMGYFYLTNVNNSWSDSAGTYLSSYKMYCNDTLYGAGASNNFTVESGSTAWSAIIVNPIPAHITVSSNRSYIIANSGDLALISSYVTDAMGNAVADNTQITYTINPGTTYSPGMGNFTGHAGSNSTTVGTMNGYANVSFGGVDGAYMGTTVTIKAASQKNSAINGIQSIAIGNNINKYDYSWVKSHSVTGTIDGAQTEYPMKFVVFRGSGSDSSGSVYLNGHSLSWPNDIRFTNAADQPLNYWVESSNDTACTIWVNIDSVPASPGTATIKIYYGRQSDPGASNGPGTFLFYDHFTDLSQWTVSVTGDAAVTVSGSEVELKSRSRAGNMAQLLTNNDYPYSNVLVWYNYRAMDEPVNGRDDECADAGIGTANPGLPNSWWNNVHIYKWSSQQSLYRFVLNSNIKYTSNTLVPDNTWSPPVDAQVYASATSINARYNGLSAYTDAWGSYPGGKYRLNVSGVGPNAFEYLHLKLDYFIIAKNTQNPPSHGSWGTETPSAPLSSTTIGFTVASSTMIDGADLSIVVHRYGNNTAQAGVTVAVCGGTAVYNTDYTTNPALPWSVSFAPGEVDKTFTVHANTGSAGKSIMLQLTGFSGATPDSYTNCTIGIIRHGGPIQQVSFPPQSTSPGHNQNGGIVGRVTTFDTTVGLAGSDIYIVNPNNVSQYYWKGTTNDQGFSS